MGKAGKVKIVLFILGDEKLRYQGLTHPHVKRATIGFFLR